MYTVQERRERFLKRVKSNRERELMNALQAIANGLIPKAGVEQYAETVLKKFNLYKESK